MHMNTFSGPRHDLDLSLKSLIRKKLM